MSRIAFKQVDGTQIAVANLTALANYNDSSLAEGTVAYVETVRTTFVKSPNTALVPMEVVNSTITGASWIRSNEPVASWEFQDDWWIDSATGNDEYDGSAGAPLRTWAEFRRRVGSIRQATVVNIVSSTFENLFGHFQNAAVLTASLIVRGVATASPAETGTVTSYDMPVTSPAVSALPGKLTASFAFNAGHYGRILRSSANGKTTYTVVLSVSGSDALTSYWSSVDTDLSNPIPTAPLEVLTLPTVPSVKIQTDGFSCRVELLEITSNQLDDTPFVSTGLSDQKSFLCGFAACIFGGHIAAGPGESTNITSCSINAANQDFPHFIQPQGGAIAFVGGGGRCSTTVQSSPGRVSFTGFIQDGRSLVIGSVAKPAALTVSVPSGGYGLGVFTSTSPNGAGLVVRSPGSSLVVSGPLFGNGNASYGLLVESGGSVNINNAIVPTLTGGTSDFQIEPPPGLVAGNMLHYSGGLQVAGASACTTWATWNGATFNRFAVNTATGSRIVNFD